MINGNEDVQVGQVAPTRNVDHCDAKEKEEGMGSRIGHRLAHFLDLRLIL